MTASVPLLFVAASVIVWLSLVVALHGLVARALVAALTGLVVAVYLAQPQLQWRWFGPWAWLVLAAVALLQLTRSQSSATKSRCSFVALAATCLCVATLLDFLIGRWVALMGGIALCLAVAAVVSTASRKFRRVKRNPQTSRLSAAYEEMQCMPAEVVDKKAKLVLLSLSRNPGQKMSVATLSECLSMSCEETWIICALLNEEQVVAFWSREPLADSTVTYSAAGGGGLREPIESLHVPPLSVVQNVIVEEGGSIVSSGDTYNMSGGVFSGAFGRNKIDNMNANTAVGNRQVEQSQVVELARALARDLPEDQASEVRQLADEIAETSDTTTLRARLQRLLGIAALVGNQGQPLLELTKRMIEGLAQS